MKGGASIGAGKAWERRKTDYFEIYRALGSVNFHEACRAVSEQWRSFAELLKARGKGRLEQEPRPPGYRKRGGERLPVIFVRFDNYEIDLRRRVLRLKYWNAEVPFTGKPRWLARSSAKLGRLTITYDPIKKRWYARVSVEVALEGRLNNGLKAGIDLGREVLAAVATEPLSNGESVALLYRGGVLKADYLYFERRIAAVDRVLADPKSEEVDRAVLREERRRLYDKRRRRRDQVFANLAARMARELAKLNVSAVFVGYPRSIAREKAGKGNVSVWSYRKLVARLATTLESRGIAAFEVPEDGTSRVCARHGCEVVRKPRGLAKCPFGHAAHSDINAAMNILKRGAQLLGCGVEVPKRVRALSFTPAPSRVIERKREKHNPAPKAG